MPRDREAAMIKVKPDWAVNVPSLAITVGGTAIGCVIAFVVLQSRVEATAGHLVRVEQRVEKLESAREADRNNLQTIRLEISDVKGDLRVIRQIVEGMQPQRTPR
jgi:hypothetical protein